MAIRLLLASNLKQLRRGDMSPFLPSVTLSGRGAEVESSPVLTGEEVPESLTDEDVPWVVLVWNDPINLMSYVVFVLQKLLVIALKRRRS